MNARQLFVACALSAFAAVSAAWASPQPLELGPLRMTPPEGWVRLDTRISVSWVPASDPTGNSCRIFVNQAELSDQPREAFTQIWRKATSAYSINRPGLPSPFIKELANGFKLAAGAYTGPLANIPWAYFGMANVSDGDAGLAFLAGGIDPTCGDAFVTFLKSLTVLARGASRDPVSAPIAYDGTGQTRLDQQRADQRTMDSQAHDRLFQQRELERQAQNRLAQQREMDRQAQQRIQDSYRRR